MATESAKGWQQEAATMPFGRQAWWQIGMLRQLALRHARLQTQLAIASQMHDYLTQFQQQTAERLANVREQLATYETSPESTPQSGSQHTALLGLIRELAAKDEEPVTSEKLKQALADREMPPRPTRVLQAAINEHYLS